MQAGLAFLAKGKHKLAFVELSAAYQASGDPALLAPLGQVHQRLGQNEEALDYYQRYLKEAPDDAPDRKEVLQSMTTLLMATPPTESAESTESASNESPTGVTLSGSSPPKDGPAQSLSGYRPLFTTRRWVGFALMGAGLVGIGVSGWLFSQNGTLAPELDCSLGLLANQPCRYNTTPGFGTGFALSGAGIVLGVALVAAPN